MGCSTCKSQKDQRPEEQIIHSFEKSLCIHKLQLITIDRVLHRYSTGKGMSISQLERAFSELSLDFSAFEYFYTRFYEKYEYNMKKLNCLGILLCDDQIPRKLKILFQCYDDNTTGMLSREQLETMLNDLTQVACIIIPKGAIKENPKDEGLIKYAKQIKSVRRSLIRQFVYGMIEGKEFISEREFNLSYQNDDGVRNILNPKAMREYCFVVKTSLIGSVDNIMQRLMESNHDQVFDMINARNYKKKRTKKRKTQVVKQELK